MTENFKGKPKFMGQSSSFYKGLFGPDALAFAEWLVKCKPFVTTFVVEVRAGLDSLSDAANPVWMNAGNHEGQGNGRNDPDTNLSGPLETDEPKDVQKPKTGLPAAKRPSGSKDGDGGNQSDDLAGATGGTGLVGTGSANAQEALPNGVIEPSGARTGPNLGNFTIDDKFPSGEGADSKNLDRNPAVICLPKTLNRQNRHATFRNQCS